jgi:beta-ureidopropionase / N-carbamoyl-L-amino-acid hydrolase
VNNFELNIDLQRLLLQVTQLADVGREPNGGTTRLALSSADKEGRDRVVGWMRAANLAVTIDPVGNIFGTRRGTSNDKAVMTGSHIDTVISAGAYDGCLGVLAGIEICRVLNDARIDTKRALVVAVFSNEEGVRFQPDMMGSLVFARGVSADDVLSAIGTDGSVYGEELAAIGYAGEQDSQAATPYAFIELHIEQGPVLEKERLDVGVVENLQGISWQEVTIQGQSNHAGTTPMELRHDSGYCAAALTTWLHDFAITAGNGQVATVGELELQPGAINVVPGSARLTIDLRNPDESRLLHAEQSLQEFLATLCANCGVDYQTRRLARYEPVVFSPDIVSGIEHACRKRNLAYRRMTSGAGHDAQMMARVCPTAMIFVPSINGVSHSADEDTSPRHIEAGANLLLDCLLNLSAR